MSASKKRKNPKFVAISRKDRTGLRAGSVFGTLLVIFLGLIGSDAVLVSPILADNAQWLQVASGYVYKELAVPVGAVTLALIAMLQLERKPVIALNFTVWQGVVAVLVGIVALGFVNFGWVAQLVSATLTFSPALVYWVIRRLA